MSVIDPQTWADAEDGRALRELREALLSKYRSDRVSVSAGVQSDGTAWADWWVEGYDIGADATAPNAPTIREAADAARAALVKR